MKRIEHDVLLDAPPCQGFRYFRGRRRFVCSDLRIWSINLAEEQAPELTGQARVDLERESRISALGFLLCSPVATPLWRRVVNHQMSREIRARSSCQRLSMELAILESLRSLL